MKRKINNQGFTLIEVLIVLILVSLVTIVITSYISSTMSLSREEAYKIMKDNVISVSYDYVLECTVGDISCNFSYDKRNWFYASELEQAGYFKEMISPIDGKYLGNCWKLNVVKENGTMIIDLNDLCY